MKTFKSHVGTAALAAVATGAILLALGARQPMPSADRGFFQPVAQIISFDDTVGMLDTVTGAVYRLHGDPAAAGARLTWELRVPPVRQATSGRLEIQRATFNHPEATFLVDIVTGQTWILHRRSGGNGSWDPVEIFR